MNNEELIKIAKKATNYSYAPYSNFHVGAALLCKNGNIYTGCNIENASYGATICAERTAIFKAISEGDKNFTKLAIVTKEDAIPFPCGMCLQVISEFMPNGQIILEDRNQLKIYQVTELLPHQFILNQE